MSKRNADQVIETRLLSIYCSSVSANHGAAFDYAKRNEVKTVSRIRWGLTGDNVFGKTTPTGMLLRFSLPTRVIVAIKEESDVSRDAEISNDMIVGTIEASFAAEYLIPEYTEESLPQGLIEKHIPPERMFRDLWPYWGETLANMAQRIRIPIPRLPAYEESSRDDKAR